MHRDLKERIRQARKSVLDNQNCETGIHPLNMGIIDYILILSATKNVQNLSHQ